MTMRFKPLLLLVALLPGTALAAPDRPGAGPGAEVIAADRAYAALAQAQGERAATRAVSAPHAEVFAPRRIAVQALGQALPAPRLAARWSPDHAWLSCDGTAGITYGRWSPPGTTQRGWYEAVWVQLRSGGYKLLLRHTGTAAPKLLSKPGTKGARAACSGRPGLPISAPAEGTDFKFGASRDQTLIWSSAVDRAGAVTITAARWDGTRHVPVLIGLQANARPANAR